MRFGERDEKMIFNQTTKKIISRNEKYCKSIWSQALGLMLSPRKNLIMEFPQEQKISLHNFLVFYPLEILILDRNKKLIEIKKNFLPFTFYHPKNKGKFVIELGKEESKGKVKVGDLLGIND